jgi:3-hydroxyisobutyrate dehydrogenase-like beta-hydroxyacid dehydrogenase
MEAGSINLLIGGCPDDVDRARTVFYAFCSAIHHLGPLGTGQVGKTVNNLLHWGTIVLLVEALEFGERLGVPAQTMQPALQAGPTDSRTLRDLDQFRLTAKWPTASTWNCPLPSSPKS